MHEKQIAYDSKVAPTYNSDRENEEHWSKENEFIAEYFIGENTETILDIPVGTGRFLKYYPANTKIYGVDISPHMIIEAQKEADRLHKKNVQFELGDAANLSSISKNSIDTIICCRLLHLVSTDDRIRFLQEFSRILKGKLILQLYIDKPRKSLFFRAFSKAIRTLQNLISPPPQNITPWSHIKSYGLSEVDLCELLQKANMCIVARSTICSYFGSNVVMLTLRNNSK